MAMALPPVPSSFYNGFMYVGEALLATVPNLWLYAPYAFGLGLVEYVGDWAKENRPRGSSEMTDDFWRYSTQGSVDLGKFVMFGYSGTGPNIPAMTANNAYAAMTSASSGSTAMRWGNMGGGLMGASNPGVNRVAGQY